MASRREYDRKRGNRHARGYGSKWTRESKAYLEEHRTCVHCGAESQCVDHIKPHRGNQRLFWSRDNWQALCLSCHSRKTKSDSPPQRSPAKRPMRFNADGSPVESDHQFYTGKAPKRWGFGIPDGIQPSAVPVTMVYGPPASGKTTYVSEHIGDRDLRISLDGCLRRIGGRKWETDQALVSRALAYRASILKGLATRQSGRAWLEMLAPTRKERDAWSQALGGVEFVKMETAKDECLRRMRADPERQHAIVELVEVTHRWFHRHTP